MSECSNVDGQQRSFPVIFLLERLSLYGYETVAWDFSFDEEGIIFTYQ